MLVPESFLLTELDVNFFGTLFGRVTRNFLGQGGFVQTAALR